MALRFRKSFKIAPGVRVNLSKSGTSYSVGRRGAMLNIGPKGKRVTVGLPGTGLSSSWMLDGKGAQRAPVPPREKRLAIMPDAGAAPSAQAVPVRRGILGKVLILAIVVLAGVMIARMAGA